VELTVLLEDALLGEGVYKLGYVTNDCDGAIEKLQAELGLELWAPFEPQFEATLADGQSGHVHLKCAFSVGHATVIELMQPVDGLVDLWAEPLSDSNELQIAFHHIGHVVDDLAAVVDSFAKVGLAPTLRTTMPVGTVAYFDLPALGHAVEYMQYFGDGGVFLETVRSPRSA
jgi:hypothetical protein